jgi:hypothetical protein
MERDELHELLLLLKQQFEAGKIKIPSAERIEELSRVRFAEDGKIDVHSVGSRVRALALFEMWGTHFSGDPLRCAPPAYAVESDVNRR